VTVVGEQKMAVYDDMSDNERIRIYDIGVDVATIDDPSSAPALPISYRTGDIVSPFIAFSEPLLLQDQHFVECVRSGAEADTPGERGLDIVRVLAETDLLHADGLGAFGRQLAAPPTLTRVAQRSARLASSPVSENRA
jgi:hypothetical protein